jgi:hypothetical protein
MTSVTSPAPTTPPTLAGPEQAIAAACAVCPHPIASHDTISLRFCTATEAQAATGRGCVCPTK